MTVDNTNGRVSMWIFLSTVCGNMLLSLFQFALLSIYRQSRIDFYLLSELNQFPLFAETLSLAALGYERLV